MIRSEATEFHYERRQQPLPRINPWRDQFDDLLLENEGKPARERLTLIRIFEELRALGYEGSYDAVRRYSRVWRQAHGSATAQAYVPLSFSPGEAYQFDWSHEIVLMNRMPVTVKVAHLRLYHSRMPFVRAYPRESQEMVFEAHARAFEFYRGACDRCVAYAKANRHPELTDQTIWQVFEAERARLVPISGRFDGFRATQASVSKTCLVRFDNNKYSVAARAVGRPVEIQTYAERIVIRQDGTIVGEHARCFGRNQTIYDPWHYVRCSPESPARCVTARLSKTGYCRPAWSMCGAG